MQATHVLAVVASLMLVFPSAVGLAGDAVETSANVDAEAPAPSDTLPDGRTMFNVGFHELPDVGVGGVYHGAEVLSVAEGPGFLTVATAQPDAFRQAAGDDPDTWTVERDSPSAMRATVTPDDRRAGAQWGIEAKPGADALGAWEAGFGTGVATTGAVHATFT